MADTIYNVLAAKFSSESARDIGQETFFFVKKYGSYAFSGQGHLRRSMRELWEREGKPRIPPSAAKIVEGAQLNFWISPKKRPKIKAPTENAGV